MGFARLTFDNATQAVTIARDARGFIALDGGFETPALISIGTDKRARPSDRETDRRGWWGDAHALVRGHEIGSLLWLLRREPLTSQTVRRAKFAADDCFRWMVEDGIAKSATAEAEADEEIGAVKLSVTIIKPDGTTWSEIWKVHFDAVE